MLCGLCRTAVFVVEHDQCGRDDGADAPRAAAPPAQRPEGGLEQRVCAFAEAAQGAVDGVVGLLVDSQLAVGGLLDRDAQQVGFAFVAQVGQAKLTVVDPGGDPSEQVGVGAGGGGVVNDSLPVTGGVDSSPTCRPRETEGAIPAGQRRAPGGKREASATMSELRKRSSVEIEYRCVLPSK